MKQFNATEKRLERVMNKIAAVDLRLKQLQKIIDETWEEYENGDS